MLHNDCYHKGSDEKKKISGCYFKGAWRQDGKPPVINNFDFDFDFDFSSVVSCGIFAGQ
jgi:hypothetical protein